MRYLIIILTLIFFTGFASSKTRSNARYTSKTSKISALYPDAKGSVACDLTDITHLVYKGKNKKIEKQAKKEKSKVPNIFTDLDTKEPKMISPDKASLIKLNESNGVYWLLSVGSKAVSTFIIDTNTKLFVQTRTINMQGITLSTSWMGKCL